MRLVDDGSANWLLYFFLPHHADEQTRSKQLCMVAILDFQFGVFLVIVPL